MIPFVSEVHQVAQHREKFVGTAQNPSGSPILRYPSVAARPAHARILLISPRVYPTVNYALSLPPVSARVKVAPRGERTIIRCFSAQALACVAIVLSRSRMKYNLSAVSKRSTSVSEVLKPQPRRGERLRPRRRNILRCIELREIVRLRETRSFVKFARQIACRCSSRCRAI